MARMDDQRKRELFDGLTCNVNDTGVPCGSDQVAIREIIRSHLQASGYKTQRMHTVTDQRYEPYVLFTKNMRSIVKKLLRNPESKSAMVQYLNKHNIYAAK